MGRSFLCASVYTWGSAVGWDVCFSPSYNFQADISPMTLQTFKGGSLSRNPSFMLPFVNASGKFTFQLPGYISDWHPITLSWEEATLNQVGFTILYVSEKTRIGWCYRCYSFAASSLCIFMSFFWDLLCPHFSCFITSPSSHFFFSIKILFICQPNPGPNLFLYCPLSPSSFQEHRVI